MNSMHTFVTRRKGRMWLQGIRGEQRGSVCTMSTDPCPTFKTASSLAVTTRSDLLLLSRICFDCLFLLRLSCLLLQVCQCKQCQLRGDDGKCCRCSFYQLVIHGNVAPADGQATECITVFFDHAACQLLLQSIKSLTILASELSIPPKILNTELYKPLQA